MEIKKLFLKKRFRTFDKKTKTMSNPNGKKGGELHQILQDKLVKQLENEVTHGGEGELIIDTEVQISTYQGKKPSRVADIAALVSDNNHRPTLVKWLRIIQVGRTDKNGEPVKRELEAIADIEQATGIEVEFFDYKTNKKIK